MEPNSLAIECPVCATRIDGVADVCLKCQTPHHQDCARFIGRCSVFGCGAFDFAARDVAAAVLQVDSANIDGASGSFEAARVAQVGLRRGIWGRIKAAARLLWANPSITVPMLLALAVMDSLMRGLLTSVSWIIVQSMLVILFVSRAKGKEANFEQAFSMFNQRAGRIFWSLFKCTVKPWLLIGLGCAVLGGAAAIGAGGGASTGFALVLIAPGAYIFWYGIRKYFAYSFVAIVAALGPDEEPKDPLERSEELFLVDTTQVLYAPFVFGLLTLPVMFLGGVLASVFDSGGQASFFVSTNPSDWIGALMMNSLLLCWVMYLVLLYLEARKVLQASSLPFTPEEFVPNQDQR